MYKTILYPYWISVYCIAYVSLIFSNSKIIKNTTSTCTCGQYFINNFIRCQKMDNKAQENFTELDLYVIAKVKEMREARGVSQLTLSQGAGFNDAFVGLVERSARREKYNLNHLNAIAKFFKCSIKEFFPDEPF